MTAGNRDIEIMAGIIHEVMFREANLDKQFERVFKVQADLPDKHRELIVTQTSRVVRNWRLLLEIAKRFGTGTSLEVMSGIQLVLDGHIQPDVSLQKMMTPARVDRILKECIQEPALYYSIPDWLYKRCENELGIDWQSIMKSFSQDPETIIRVNTLRTNRENVKQLFQKQGVVAEFSSLVPDALVIQGRMNIFRFPEFKEGYFEMQDSGSQRISEFTKPRPGDRLIDACCGYGSKTLHLAALMQNKGRIIAMDIHSHKLDRLKQRCRQAGVTNVETRLIDTTKVIKRLHHTADIVLLDVPCSGLGVLKRNMEIKWRLDEQSLDKLIVTQQEILNQYSKMVKPSGTVIYATCSILPSENEEQVKSFLEKNKDTFLLAEEQKILPDKGTDGYYMARLQRIQ